MISIRYLTKPAFCNFCEGKIIIVMTQISSWDGMEKSAFSIFCMVHV